MLNRRPGYNMLQSSLCWHVWKDLHAWWPGFFHVFIRLCVNPCICLSFYPLSSFMDVSHYTTSRDSIYMIMLACTNIKNCTGQSKQYYKSNCMELHMLKKFYSMLVSTVQLDAWCSLHTEVGIHVMPVHIGQLPEPWISPCYIEYNTLHDMA